MNIFEMATRNKFRFPYKGLISVEDLWDLGQVQLDSIYKNLNKEIKQIQEESLLSAKNSEDAELQAKIDIVKYIFTVKQQEAIQRGIDAENADKKRRIMEILAQKQDDSLMGKSEDELRKMLKELES